MATCHDPIAMVRQIASHLSLDPHLLSKEWHGDTFKLKERQEASIALLAHVLAQFLVLTLKC